MEEKKSVLSSELIIFVELMESKYHIITDLQCRVLHYGKEICIAIPGKDCVIFLSKGRHLLNFVSISNEKDNVRMMLEVPENDIEDFIDVGLSPIMKRRLKITPEAVDLGLPSGLKWGTFNIGALAPEDFGEYYAWGEIAPKEDYGSFNTYKWFNGKGFTKYIIHPSGYDDIYGGPWIGEGEVPDHKYELDKEDDVAQALLGDKWHIPTSKDWFELIDYCKKSWTTQNNVNGYKISGQNGNSIFLPAAGLKSRIGLSNVGEFGCYWSSSLYPMSCLDALELRFCRITGIFRRAFDLESEVRYDGLVIRPVCEQ